MSASKSGLLLLATLSLILTGCGSGSSKPAEGPNLSKEAAGAKADKVEDIKEDINNAREKGDPPAKPETIVGLAEDMFKTVEAEAESVTKDHVLSLKIYYTNPAQAHEAAQQFTKEGFTCEVLPPAPDSTRTAILAKIQLKPSLANLKNAMGIVNAQLEALEGEYDTYTLSQGTMADTK